MTLVRLVAPADRLAVFEDSPNATDGLAAPEAWVDRVRREVEPVDGVGGEVTALAAGTRPRNTNSNDCSR